MDSNQQPSGYLSALVGRDVRVIDNGYYGEIAQIYEAGPLTMVLVEVPFGEFKSESLLRTLEGVEPCVEPCV